MTVYPVFIDSCPVYGREAGRAASLLRIPLGSGSMLRYLYECISVVAQGEPRILTTFEADGDYERFARGALGKARVRVSRGFDAFL